MLSHKVINAVHPFAIEKTFEGYVLNVSDSTVWQILVVFWVMVVTHDMRSNLVMLN